MPPPPPPHDAGGLADAQPPGCRRPTTRSASPASRCLLGDIDDPAACEGGRVVIDRRAGQRQPRPEHGSDRGTHLRHRGSTGCSASRQRQLRDRRHTSTPATVEPAGTHRVLRRLRRRRGCRRRARPSSTNTRVPVKRHVGELGEDAAALALTRSRCCSRSTNWSRSTRRPRAARCRRALEGGVVAHRRPGQIHEPELDEDAAADLGDVVRDRRVVHVHRRIGREDPATLVELFPFSIVNVLIVTGGASITKHRRRRRRRRARHHPHRSSVTLLNTSQLPRQWPCTKHRAAAVDRVLQRRLVRRAVSTKNTRRRRRRPSREHSHDYGRRHGGHEREPPTTSHNDSSLSTHDKAHKPHWSVGLTAPKG